MWSPDRHRALRARACRKRSRRAQAHRPAVAGKSHRCNRSFSLKIDQLETRQLLAGAAGAASPSSLEILNVQLKPGTAGSLAELMPLFNSAGATAESTPIAGLYEVDAPAAGINALATALASSTSVQFASLMGTIHDDAVPNDPYYANNGQWALTGPWEVSAPLAWNASTGSNQVIVATVDTGINYNHPDLVNNVWLNQADIPSTVLPNLTDLNGDGLITFSDLNNPVNQGPGKIIDTNSDGVITATDVLAPLSSGGWASGAAPSAVNAYPDDFIGWNFVASNNNPLDDNGHGTHVAGIIGAVGNNGIGIAGVDWNTQIMALKALDSTGTGNDVEATLAIDYAVAHGAKVINASWGEAGIDPVLATAIQYADSMGVIIVAAAGNSSANDSTTAYSPASYSATYPNVITVAATDSGGNLASWSNYGVGTVQLAAPGANILSTFDGSYAFLSGTSMAAPFVTGTVALVEAAHPAWSMSQVVDAVLDHTTPDPALAGLVTTGGIVNAAAAVANTDGAHVVSATPNSTPNSATALSSVLVTFNEEINPATFTPAQVTLTGPAGAISGVSVSPVAGSNDHQFLISFPPQSVAAPCTLSVGPSIKDWYGNAMDQNQNGTNGEASDAFTATFGPTLSQTAAVASATFIKRDTTTKGNWIGSYGSQGYNIIGNSTIDPTYTTVTAEGATTGTFVATTTDPRALQNASGTGRTAGCWFGSTFSVDVNLTDGQAHDLTLYAVDWSNIGRSEQIQITSAGTGAILDTETLSNFYSGAYLQWKLSGSVAITVKTLAGANSVLSGLFFDAPSATAQASPDHLSVSTASANDIAGVPQTFTITALLPSGAVDTHYTGTVQLTSTDPQALLPAAYTFISTDAGIHAFSVVFNTPGTQSITATDSATATITGSISVTVSSPGASATFLKRDTTTKGNWIGSYGSQGYNIIGNSASYPSYATVTTFGTTTGTFVAATTDPRALQNASGTGRTAACWFGSTYSVDVNLTDGQAHDLTLYAIDWSNIGRTEQIQIKSAGTGAVLDTETLSNFYGGAYLQWKLSGSVVMTLKTLAGANSVLSGIFFDGPSASAAAVLTPPADRAGMIASNASPPSGNLSAVEMGSLSFTSPSDPQSLSPAPSKRNQ
jgi:subtilisin family serine protease